MPKKYLIVLFFMAFVGARHAVPLQGLPLLSDTAFAATQENGQPCPPECVTDSMEIITYYPSPYGYYEELRGDKIIVGDTDNSHIDETHLPPSGTLTFEPKSYAQITTEGTLYEGTVYYDSFDHEFKYYDNNSSWQPLGGGGGDYWKPSTASGGSENIYYTSSGNVGIGVEESDTIGAKLQINMSSGIKGLVIKAGANTLGSSFKYTGALQTYQIPLGVKQVTITVYGAAGASATSGNNGAGGLGGKVVGTINVIPGEKLYVYVGGNDGWNGGGAAVQGAGAGGGASDIRQNGTALANRVIVAGGGGGGGNGGGGTAGGGGSGGFNGNAGTNGKCSYGGGGGTQGDKGSGGAGASCGTGCSVANGTAGSLGLGGAGGVVVACDGGGGGGGGYYGGGGAGSGAWAGGGGGGSSYIISTATGTSTTSGVQSGNGQVIITPVGTENMTEWKDATDRILAMIDIEGKVGIGTTGSPAAYLDIAAGKTTLADAWSTRSSLRFKENLYPIDNALNKLTSLQGVYFDYKDNHKHSLGLVAEDVGKVFPELVTYEPNGQDAISLDYDKLGAVTIEAIKEQQKEIEQLKEALRGQEEKSRENQDKLRKQQKEIELLKAGKL